MNAQVALRAPGRLHRENVTHTVVTDSMLTVPIHLIFTIHQEHGFRLLKADWTRLGVKLKHGAPLEIIHVPLTFIFSSPLLLAPFALLAGLVGFIPTLTVLALLFLVAELVSSSWAYSNSPGLVGLPPGPVGPAWKQAKVVRVQAVFSDVRVGNNDAARAPRGLEFSARG